MGQGSNTVACVYLRKVDSAGARVSGSHFFEMGEVPDINFSIPSEITSFPGNTCETDGLTVDTLVLPGTAEGTLATFNVNSKIVGMMFNTEPTEVVNPGSTLTALDITEAWSFGDWVETGKENLDTDIIVQDSTDTTTYVEGTDYKINRSLGLIKFLFSGSVTESSEFHVSGTELPKTFQRITIQKGDVGFFEVKTVSKNRTGGGENVKDHLLCCRVVATSSRVIGVEATSSDRTRVEFQFIPQIPDGGNSYGVIDGLPKMVGA